MSCDAARERRARVATQGGTLQLASSEAQARMLLQGRVTERSLDALGLDTCMGTTFPTVPVDNIGHNIPNGSWSVGGRFLPNAAQGCVASTACGSRTGGSVSSGHRVAGHPRPWASRRLHGRGVPSSEAAARAAGRDLATRCSCRVLCRRVSHAGPARRLPGRPQGEAAQARAGQRCGGGRNAAGPSEPPASPPWCHTRAGGRALRAPRRTRG